jgi:hypothetical protein
VKRADAPISCEPVPDAPTPGNRLAGLTALGAPLALFLGSRLVVWSAVYAAKLVAVRYTFAQTLTRWDGEWYGDIVKYGYPSAVRGPGTPVQSRVAFFPGYPLVVKAITVVTPLGPRGAAVLANTAFAGAACVLLWLLVRRLVDEDCAVRAVALFCFFPGSFVLGLAYSEGLFLAAAIGCFLLVLDRRWVPAGVLCAVAGATRPTGLVVLAALGLAAVLAVREQRSARPLTAPAIGSLGFLGYSLYLARHTGSATSWVYAQRRGWHQRLDFGANTAHAVGHALAHPTNDMNITINVLALAAAAGLVALWLWRPRWRPPAFLAVYAAGVLAAATLSASLFSSARFTMTAFPLFIAAARRLRGVPFLVVLGAFAGALGTLTMLALGTNFYTP